jgi:hypothetical protein
MARELRELGVITPGTPGRGKRTAYTEEDEAVAVAWQLAKKDPAYQEKSDYAVLIAYAGGAPIRTEGLRWAWCKCYDRQRDRIVSQAGMRVREPSWLDSPPAVRRAASRVFEAAAYSEPIPRKDWDTLLSSREPAILDALAHLPDALVPFCTPDETAELRSAIETLVSALPVPTASPDIRPHIASFKDHLQKAPEYLSTRAARIVAEEADRELLDDVRDDLLTLRAAGSVEPFCLTDWELAVSVPHFALVFDLHDGTRRRPPTRRRSQ